MPKFHRREEDEYELRETSASSSHDMDADAEPLLPRYTSTPDPDAPSASIKTVNVGNDKPFKRQTSANTRRAIQCIGIGLLLTLLGFGLGGCLFGRTAIDKVRGWHKWEQVPPEFREWLNKVVPPERLYADHGAFPTK
jgi:hypothetical protein